MRRKDREMDRAFALNVIDKCEYAVIAMITPDGLPYCVPLSVARDGEYLYFHSASAGKKLDALAANPSVCVTCVGDVCPLNDKFTTKYESAIIEGSAVRITDEKEKISALRIICMRYTPENMPQFDAAIERSITRTEIFRIGLENVTGKCKR